MSDPRAIRYEATSILELGAKGVLDGVPFTLGGRRCIRGHRGAIWNEWTLDGIAHATLAESAGRFTLYREGSLLDPETLLVGERPPWLVVERGTATCAATFGAVAPAPDHWEYVDLSSIGDGQRATLSGAVSFLGTSVDPGALGLTIRREPPALVPTPNVAMPSGIQLWLDVGDSGTLEGVTWHVVGIVARKTETLAWEEYCVYAAGVGLRWLVVVDGRWSYVWPVEPGTLSAPLPSHVSRVAHEQADEPALPRVTWAAGELAWQVEIGETVMSFERGDFVCEYGLHDITWSKQHPLETDAVARAFQKRAMPRPR